MPHAAYGLAALLCVGWAVASASAQNTPAAGSPRLSTDLPPEPPSHNLPSEPAATPGPAPSGSVAPVLGAPVGPADRLVARPPAASPPAVPVVQGLQPVTGTLPTANSGDSSLATTPVLNYQPPANSRRGAGLGNPTAATAQLLGPSYPVSTVSASTDPVPTSSWPRTDSHAMVTAPAQVSASIPSVNSLVPDVGAPAPAPDPVDFLRERNKKPLSDAASGPSDKSTHSFGGDFGEKLTQALGKRDEWFRSDHAFDGFISPVTNPFLFEDPRSLTEIRPIFLIEKIPGSEPDFRGGNTFFFGTQLRLAITDRLSFTINKLGGESFNPGSDSAYPGGTGFAEFWFGAKYTFIRNEQTGTVMAGGLQFQIPTGGRTNFQDTGSLSLVPYFSVAQTFLRDFSFGSFNAMATTGFSFSVNDERSDYLFLSGHVDMNVLNRNHFFPFIEANWFVTTTNGKSTPVGIEGQDLINFGGRAAGQGYLSTAFGARYKFNECYQVGGALEFPIAGPRDIDNFRFTLDFIFRY